jgi:hypothetical protein
MVRSGAHRVTTSTGFMASSIFSFYGCRLRSEVPLSFVPVCARQDEPADVVLNLGDIARAQDKPTWSSPFVSIAADGATLIEVAAVGRFLLRDGCEIKVEPAPSAAPIEIETLLIGPVAGVLLHQRGVFPLHASCIELDGLAVAIAGASGRGKSTLAAALVRRGATLFSDDICALRLSDGQPAIALQGGTGLCLWPDSRVALQGRDAWLPIRPGHAKQVARLHAAELGSRRLATIIRLAPERGDVRPGIRRLYGPPAMAPMAEVIYRVWLGGLLGRGQHLFRDVMHLAGAVPVYYLQRPPGLDRIEEAVDWVATAAGTL